MSTLGPCRPGHSELTCGQAPLELAAPATTAAAAEAAPGPSAPPSKRSERVPNLSQAAILAAKERKRARRLAKKSRARVDDNGNCDPASSQATIAGSPPQSPSAAAATNTPPAPPSSALSSSVWRSSSAFTTPPPRYECLRASRPAPAFSQDTCCASPDVAVVAEVCPKEEEAMPRASLPRKAKAVSAAVEEEPRSPPYWRLATAQWRGMQARRAADPKKRPPAVADIRLTASARAADASRRKWLIQKETADQWLSKRRSSLRSSHGVKGGQEEGEGGDDGTEGGKHAEAEPCRADLR